MEVNSTLTVFILILAYLSWIGDVIEMGASHDRTTIVPGALVAILSWQVSLPWGITMTVICTIIGLIGTIVMSNKRR